MAASTGTSVVVDLVKHWFGRIMATVVAIGIFVGLYAWLGHRVAHRGVDGSVQNKGGMGVSRLAAGDCLKAVPDGETVSAVTAIPCDEPHTAQVYGLYKSNLISISKPDDPAVRDAGTSGCRDMRATALDAGKLPAGAIFGMLMPEDTSVRGGGGAFTCLVEAPDAWTGSIVTSAAQSTAAGSAQPTAATSATASAHPVG